MWVCVIAIRTIHKSPKENLEIRKHAADVFGGDSPFAGATALVGFEPSLDVRALLFREPLCLFGEVRQEPEDDERHGAG